MISPFRSTTKRSAFTLIEMLVVIAIIALLASLIVPAVGSALVRARITQCLSNQKQIAAAMLQYPGDHQGRLPYAEIRPGRTVGADTPENWAGTLIREGYISAPTPEDADDIPAASVFLCPDGVNDRANTVTPGGSPWAEDQGHNPRPMEFELKNGERRIIHIGYGINATLNPSHSGWPFNAPTSSRNPTTLAMVKFPSRTVMIYDGKWFHNTDQDRILARHGKPRNRTIMAFFDGSTHSFVTRLFPVGEGGERDIYPRFKR